MLDMCCCVKASKIYTHNRSDGEMTLISFFKKYYGPFILSKLTRVLIVVVFLVTLCLSIALAPKITVGLESELSLTNSSYLADYYRVSTCLINK